jgi:hypothetical protein
MSRVSPETWIRLAGEQVPGQALWAKFAVPSVTERVLAAIDAEGWRHLLVLLEPGEVDLHDAQSRGITVSTRELVITGRESGRYLDVLCCDGTGYDALDVIGGEIASRLAAGNESGPEVVSRVLSKWRRFWGQPIRRLLSREEQLGLFAELWFMCVWLIPSVGVEEAVKRWKGPMGSRHDFEWSGRSVEVKATTTVRGRVHRINGIDQLAPPEGGSLMMFSLQLREEAGATNTLPAILARCATLLEPHPEALGRFESCLDQAGYLRVDEEEYSKLRLRVVEEGLFTVSRDFPRITRVELGGHLPAGVETLEYEINLSGSMHLCVSAQSAAPTGAQFLK